MSDSQNLDALLDKLQSIAARAEKPDRDTVRSAIALLAANNRQIIRNTERDANDARFAKRSANS